LAIYVTTILRVLNAPLHPFDYAAAVEEIAQAVRSYQTAADGEFDFSAVLADLETLAADIRAWRLDVAARAQTAKDRALQKQANHVLRRLARVLVPLNYARGERFDHDP